MKPKTTPEAPMMCCPGRVVSHAPSPELSAVMPATCQNRRDPSTAMTMPSSRNGNEFATRWLKPECSSGEVARPESESAFHDCRLKASRSSGMSVSTISRTHIRASSASTGTNLDRWGLRPTLVLRCATGGCELRPEGEEPESEPKRIRDSSAEKRGELLELMAQLWVKKLGEPRKIGPVGQT